MSQFFYYPYSIGHQSKNTKYTSNRGFSEIQLTRTNKNKFSYDEYALGKCLKTGRLFIYNIQEQETLLYNAKPCIYTDANFIASNDTNHLFWSMRKGNTLKKMKRLCKSFYNLPKGYVFEFRKCYYHKGKRVNLNYIHKVKNPKCFEPQYKIDDSYEGKDIIVESSWDYYGLVKALRENGFLVKIYKSNRNRIRSMIQSAMDYLNSDQKLPLLEEEKTLSVVAYGHGKKIGFTANSDSLFGYSLGEASVIWDWGDSFNKWSQCYEISKQSSIEDIVKQLIVTKEEFNEY